MLICSNVARKTDNSIEMIGQGQLFSIPDEEINDINKLLQNHNLPPLSATQGRIFIKTQINGQAYYSTINKQVTKRNSYTVGYTTSNSVYYGIVKHYLRISDHNLAAIDCLQCQHTGPTETFMSSIITLEDEKLLFEDYLTCIIADKQYILVNQISEKLCNLSFDNWIFITPLINNVEIE